MKFYVHEDPVTGQAFVRCFGFEGNLCEAFAWGNVSAKDNAFVIMKGVQAASMVASDMLKEMRDEKRSKWKEKADTEQGDKADPHGHRHPQGDPDCSP